MGKFASVDDYIATLDAQRAAIVRSLRALVLASVPDATEVIKWAQPVYELGGPFAYIKAYARYVNLGFWRGAALDDPAGLVQSGGEKMGHVRITSLDELDDRRVRQLRPLVRQAARLNVRLGDPSRTR